jgi:PepSY-associated TM region
VESASASIDEKIKELGDWRGKTLAKVREIIHEADPARASRSPGERAASGPARFISQRSARALARVHFWRAWETEVKTLYVILGLVPAVLFVTGAIMWWNRVLRPALKTDTLAETTQAASLSPDP